MKKTELIEIAERYNMDFIRHHITGEGTGVYRESADLIPELDAICDSKEFDNVAGERVLVPGSGYIYRIYCPAQWIDLYGWN